MSGVWPYIAPPSVTYCQLPPVTSWEAPLSEAVFKLPIPFLLFQNASFPYNSTGLVVTDIHFCAPGYIYFGVIVTGIFLFLISGACLAYLIRWYRHQNTLRKLLFGLLSFIGLSRFIFCSVAYQRLSEFHTFREIFDGMVFLVHATIPLTASSDIVQSYIDFLLTFFWLDMLYPQIMASLAGKLVPILLALAASITGVVCIALDYHDIVVDHRYSRGNLYIRTLSFTGALLLVSALLHTAVVISLLRKMLRVGLQDVLMSPSLRKQIILVAIICCASVICMVGRAVVLLGRVTNVEYFVTGPLSFANPDFTAAYFIGFLNMPALAVAVSFFVLTVEMVRESSLLDGRHINAPSYYGTSSARDSMDNLGGRNPLLGEAAAGAPTSSANSFEGRYVRGASLVPAVSSGSGRRHGPHNSGSFHIVPSHAGATEKDGS